MKGKLKKNKKLYTGPKFTCTDVFPGVKQNNGGEYGFYTTYSPTEKPGKYAVRTWTTCDFDDVHTGPQGYVWLTKKKVAELLAESQKIEGYGNLYEYGCRPYFENGSWKSEQPPSKLSV